MNLLNKLSDRKQKFITVSLYFFIFAIFGYYVFWYNVADMVRKSILEDFTVAEQSGQISPALKKISSSGFPFSLNTKIEGLNLKVKSMNGDFDLQNADVHINCNFLISNCKFFVSDQLEIKSSNDDYYQISLNNPSIKAMFNKGLLISSLMKSKVDIKSEISFLEFKVDSILVNKVLKGDGNKIDLFKVKNIDFLFGDDPYRYSSQKGNNIFYVLEIENFRSDFFPFAKLNSRLDLRSYKTESSDKVILRTAEFKIDYLDLKLTGDILFNKEKKTITPDINLNVDSLHNLSEFFARYFLSQKEGSAEVAFYAPKLENLFNSVFEKKQNYYQVKISSKDSKEINIGKLNSTILAGEILKIFLTKQ